METNHCAVVHTLKNLSMCNFNKHYATIFWLTSDKGLVFRAVNKMDYSKDNFTRKWHAVFLHPPPCRYKVARPQNIYGLHSKTRMQHSPKQLKYVDGDLFQKVKNKFKKKKKTHKMALYSLSNVIQVSAGPKILNWLFFFKYSHTKSEVSTWAQQQAKGVNKVFSNHFGI